MIKGKKGTRPAAEILRILGVFRTGGAIEAGVSQPTVSPPTLSRLAAAGAISRLEMASIHTPLQLLIFLSWILRS